MKYGLPYQGSKSRVALSIVQQLPACPGGTLYDVFCGGCAVTHAAMLERLYGRFVINDINPLPPEAFVRAVNGGFKNETRWISREDFLRLKDTDPYVAFCWSFGNDGRTYMYGRTIEPYKRAVHYVIFFNEWEEFAALCPEVTPAAWAALKDLPLTDRKTRRIEFGRAVVKELKRLSDWDLVVNNPLYKSCHWRGGFEGTKGRGQDLQSLESLQSLQSLQSLERLESYSGDYQDVPVTGPGVIYCDPPYKGTKGYKSVAFDHDRFYDWCERQPLPVYISEYDMPPDRFVEVFKAERLCSMAAAKASTVVERLFRPRVQVERKAVA